MTRTRTFLALGLIVFAVVAAYVVLTGDARAPQAILGKASVISAILGKA